MHTKLSMLHLILSVYLPVKRAKHNCVIYGCTLKDQNYKEKCLL